MPRLPSIVVIVLAMTMSAAASEPVLLHAAQRVLAKHGFAAPLLPP
jgi:hypothetical protein